MTEGYTLNNLKNELYGYNIPFSGVLGPSIHDQLQVVDQVAFWDQKILLGQIQIELYEIVLK